MNSRTNRIGRVTCMVIFLLLNTTASVVAAPPGAPPPPTPQAISDNYTMDEDSTLTEDVKDNDANLRPNADAVLITGPSHASSFTLNEDGTFSYTPTLNYTGTDIFTYVLRLGAEPAPLETPAVVTITISPEPEAPVAVNDGYTFLANTVLIATSVLANDTDADTAASSLTATRLTSPTNGTIGVFNADGTFTYTPNTDFVGSDSFTYRVSDGALNSNTATVSLTIQAPPCPAGFTGTFPSCVPINNAPVTASDTRSTDEDTALNGSSVLANDSDPEALPLSAILGTTTSNGILSLNSDGTFTYTPNANYNGPDSFTYQASDGTIQSALTTVSITVNPVNDAPSALNDSGYSVVGNSSLVGAASVLGNDTDIDSLSLTADKVTDPSNGTVSLASDGTFTYTPTAGYVGPDSFTYRANDGGLNSNIATVAITVSAPPVCPVGFTGTPPACIPIVIPINLPPIGLNDSFGTDEDTTLNGTSVLGNDSDPEASALTATLGSTTSNGSLTLNADGTFTYVPTPNFHGSDSFTYTASDGLLSSIAVTVNITVNSINDVPAASPASYVLDEDTFVTDDLVAGSLLIPSVAVVTPQVDVDGDPITAVPGTEPLHGTLTLNQEGVFVYTPHANFFGADSFTYSVSDDALASTLGATGSVYALSTSSPVTVSLIINPVNDAPVANNDSGTWSVGTLTLNVLTNDSDIDGTLVPGSVEIISGPANGTAFVNSSGQVIYAPVSGFAGADALTYRACDDGGACDTALVSITVEGVRGVQVTTPQRTDTIVQTITTALGASPQGSPAPSGLGGLLPNTGMETFPMLVLALGFFLEGAMILKVDRKRHTGRRLAR